MKIRPALASRSPWIVLSGMAALVLLLKLDYSNLFLFDESLYCGATADMAAHGTWLYPTDGGEFYGIYGKPPLVNWLQAVSAWVFGWSIFALRLPTALGMLSLILLTGYTATRLVGRRAGLVAAGMMLLSTGIVHTGRHILLENLLAPLICAALIVYAKSTQPSSDDRGTALWRGVCVVAAGILLALAILTKQAFALCAPAAIVTAELICRRPGWLLRLAVLGATTSLASAWWFAATYVEVGAPFVDSIVGYHIVERFGHALEGHVRGLNAYAKSLDAHLRLLPWSIAAIGWVAIYGRLVEAWHRFLFIAWSALAAIEFVLVGMVVKTFLPWYQLIVMPPLFIGAASFLLTWLRLASLPRWVRWSVPLAIGTAAATSARLDAVIALATLAVLALLLARYGWLERLTHRQREVAAAAMVGVVGVVVANPWHGGDGRYATAALLSERQVAPDRVTVIGDDWLRVWMCYTPDARRLQWRGRCADLLAPTRDARAVVLDGKSAQCEVAALDLGREIYRGKTKQGPIVAFVR